MNNDELMRKIFEYGADEHGINDRFMGNTQLYAMCFNEFLEEENFALLDAAIEKGDYKEAFLASHALKGISGNLGLSTFYEQVSDLVELLREKVIVKDEKRIRSSYESLKDELAMLRGIAAA